MKHEIFALVATIGLCLFVGVIFIVRANQVMDSGSYILLWISMCLLAVGVIGHAGTVQIKSSKSL